MRLPALVLLAVSTLGLGCRAADGVLSLLPATSAGRIEAAVRIEDGARLELAWEGAEAVAVWAHRNGEQGQLVATHRAGRDGEETTATVDLGSLAGGECLVRLATVERNVQWIKADLVQRGKPEAWVIRPRSGRPNVVLYVLDTLRPDVLGTYGGPGPTPNLDRFAQQGTLFERAYATASWTRPSVASLLSGLPTSAHTVAGSAFSLPEGILTLAERFRLRGYQTVGVTANGHVNASFNFDQGFEFHSYLKGAADAGPADMWDPAYRVKYPRAPQVHAEVLHLLGSARDLERPLFLYVHVVDPHSPYDPERWLLPGSRPAINVNNYLMRNLAIGDRGSVAVRQALARAYHGAVAYADEQFGVFFVQLGAIVDLDRTVVAVVSDHGEGFFEHGVAGHHQWLDEEQTRIVMALGGPGVPAGRRDTRPASLVDIVPTLNRIVDPDRGPAAGTMGRDLLAPEPESPFAVSEHEDGLVLVQGEWKLTYRRNYPEALRFSLFNLRRDPLATRNVAAANPHAFRRLRAELRSWTSLVRERAVEALPVARGEIDPEQVKQLQALGYLN